MKTQKQLRIEREAYRDNNTGDLLVGVTCAFIAILMITGVI